MFAELLEHKLQSTLQICHAFAQWVLKGDDLEWSQKEYRKMFEFEVFAKSDLFQVMEKAANERAQRWAEQKVQEEHELAEKRVLEERKKVLEERKKIVEERKKIVAMLRQNVVELVSQRFPTLKRLAKMQVRKVQELESLRQVMLRLSLVSGSDEAENVLFALSEKEEEDE
jgi:hypothetical protein